MVAKIHRKDKQVSETFHLESVGTNLENFFPIFYQTSCYHLKTP